jgi:hypothetical protein
LKSNPRLLKFLASWGCNRSNTTARARRRDMPGQAKYLMIASMDVDPEHDAIFNEVYDKEHVPNLGKVPGVLGISRYRRGELTMNIGGERKTIEIPNEPSYVAIYELESPDVLTSAAWDKAIEDGRWPAQVRPYTKNRRHVLLKLMEPEK